MNRDTTSPPDRYHARGQYFGDVARGYDAARQRSVYDRWKWRREHAAVARALAAISPVGRILDLPTGTGRFLGQLAARASNGLTVGADISPDMLGLAHQRLGALSAVAIPALVAAEAERLPFGDGSFDIVVSIRFFQHLPVNTVAPLLRELCRVSQRGVLVQVPLSHALSPAVRGASRLLHRLTGSHIGSPVRQVSSRYFPCRRHQLDSLLRDLGLRVHSARAVTWWAGQLRLVHVAS